MRIRSFLMASSCVASLFTSAAAQLGSSRGEVIGLTHGTPMLISQQMDPINGCPGTRCAPAGFEVQVAPWSGGTAYDGTVHGVWISNGQWLANVDPDNCRYLCPPRRAPFPVAAQPNRPLLVTGLSLLEAGNGLSSAAATTPPWLFMSDSYDNITLMKTANCQFSSTHCNWSSILNPAVTPTPRRIGGIATDDKRRVLYVATSVFGTAAPNNVIYAAPINSLCQPTCKLAINRCGSNPLGAITGIAYDSCKDLLFVTDGKQVVYGKISGCTFAVLGCCQGLAERYTGLAVRAARTASVGRSCTQGACRNCPAMRASLVGDPVIGNSAFAFRLQNAPSNYGIAFLGIGLGPCSPTGIPMGFCETVKIGLAATVVVGFGPSLSIPPCGGNITVPAPVPNNYGFCGLSLSAQWVLGCRSAAMPMGDAVSNCLSFRVSGT